MSAITAQVAVGAPSYCSGAVKVLTPSQWKTCWDAGWSQPTTAAANAGQFAGHNIGPILVVLAIVIALIALARRGRSGSTATSS